MVQGCPESSPPFSVPERHGLVLTEFHCLLRRRFAPVPYPVGSSETDQGGARPERRSANQGQAPSRGAREREGAPLHTAPRRCPPGQRRHHSTEHRGQQDAPTSQGHVNAATSEKQLADSCTVSDTPKSGQTMTLLEAPSSKNPHSVHTCVCRRSLWELEDLWERHRYVSKLQGRSERHAADGPTSTSPQEGHF